MTSQTSQFQRTGLPCTILFVDVCGSTQLYETLGNARAQSIIAKMLEVLSSSATRHVGSVIKTIGDEVMCSFGTARDAAHAAVEMQRLVKQAVGLEGTGVKNMSVRVGFHSGPVISHAADVFGDTVNVAARVVAHAKPGQILVAKQTVRKLPKEIAASMRFVGSTAVKGKKDPVDLYELVWERENMTLVQDVASLEARPESVRLTATLGTQTVELSNGRPALNMGRDPENEFVIADPLASRMHARIEFRRDEMVLESSGLISLGKSTSAAQETCVRFRVNRGAPTPDRAMLRKHQNR